MVIHWISDSLIYVILRASFAGQGTTACIVTWGHMEESATGRSSKEDAVISIRRGETLQYVLGSLEKNEVVQRNYIAKSVPRSARSASGAQ